MPTVHATRGEHDKVVMVVPAAAIERTRQRLTARGFQIEQEQMTEGERVHALIERLDSRSVGDPPVDLTDLRPSADKE